MKKMKLAIPLIAAALSVAACSKHEDVTTNSTTETVTLNEGEVTEPTNFTDAGNAAAPDAALIDNGIVGNGGAGNDAGPVANTL